MAQATETNIIHLASGTILNAGLLPEDVTGLACLYDAYCAAADAYAAVMNQSRCLSDAHMVLVRKRTEVCKMADAMVEALWRATPETEEEVAERFRVIIGHEMECGTPAARVAEMAAELSRKGVH